MLTILTACIFITPADLVSSKDLSILFFGNSHTGNGMVYSQVEKLLESDGNHKNVIVEYTGAGFIRGIWNSPKLKDNILNGDWDYIVFQGQEISASHKYEYSKTEAIELAKLAKKGGAKALFFAEWPLKGIDESDYIYNIYDSIAKKSEAEVIPICYSFEYASKVAPKMNLMSGDGNHSSLLGAHLASLTIYYWIAGASGKPGVINIKGVTEKESQTLRPIAAHVVKTCRANPKQIPSAVKWRAK